MLGQQLILNIRQSLSFDFASYIPGGNAQVLERLKQVAQGDQTGFYFIWGPSGVGKSHLLQAACQQAHDVQLGSIYLCAEQLVQLEPEALEQLEQYPLVALDNIEVLAGDTRWEEALFHLYNRIMLFEHALVISSEQSPQSLDITLPDLKSRLKAGETYHLKLLDDTQKITYLHAAARQRGFSLGKDVAEFILQRAARDVHSLTWIIDQLDQISLSEHRQVTIPLVKQTFDL